MRAALVALRIQAGLTQVDLAERLGRSQGHVSEVERGIKRIDPLQVWDWCRACGTDLAAWAQLTEACIAQAQAGTLSTFSPTPPTE